MSYHDPCVVFALGWEAGPFLREFRPQQRFAGAPCRARFCGPEWLSVLVLETGIGPARVETALGWALSGPRLGQVAYRPKVVLSAGFSGALRDGLRVGDVILATDVVDGDGQCWPTTWPGELPAGDWRPPLRRGRLLSLPRLVGDPADKQRLGASSDALAVDMETATIARLCARHNVPFGCLRVVSDEIDTPLSPELLSVLSRPDVAPLRLAAAVARSPGLARELWRLGRHTRSAAARLGTALGEVLTLTLPWGREL